MNMLPFMDDRKNNGGGRKGERDNSFFPIRNIMTTMEDIEMGETAMPSTEDILKAAENGLLGLFEGLSPSQLHQVSLIRNEDLRSPFHIAAAFGHAQIVRFFSEVHGVLEKNLNAGDEEGWTPLHSAVSSGHIPVIEILLDIGVDVSSVTNAGRTALHYAASKGWTKIAGLLINHGAKLNHKDKFGCTPLHRAASAGHPEMCELLIEEGATVDALDKTGQTPLMYATICNDRQVALLLIRHGANVDAEDKEGYTVLGRASDDFRPILVDAAKAMLEY